jgi:hypothetical protein
MFIDDEDISCSSSESESEDEVSSSSESPPIAGPSEAAEVDSSKQKKKPTTRATRKRSAPKKSFKPKATPNKKRKGKNSEVVKVDIAKASSLVKIPDFEVHLGKDWFVKVSLFNGNEKYYVCLRNFKGNKPGYGANLPIEMIEEIVKGYNLAHEHIQKHARI